jgi:hypothetical protein
LYEESKKRWMKNEECVDDITIILIYFEEWNYFVIILEVILFFIIKIYILFIN